MKWLVLLIKIFWYKNSRVYINVLWVRWTSNELLNKQERHRISSTQGCKCFLSLINICLNVLSFRCMMNEISNIFIRTAWQTCETHNMFESWNIYNDQWFAIILSDSALRCCHLDGWWLKFWVYWSELLYKHERHRISSSHETFTMMSGLQYC